MKKLGSLSELASVKHLFEDKEEPSIPKLGCKKKNEPTIPKLDSKNKKEPRLKNKNKAFKGRKKAFDGVSKDLANRSKPQIFRLHGNLCSVKLHDEKFTNKLKTLNDCNENTIVKAIFGIDGQAYTDQKDIPFQIDENDTLNVGPRHRKIMLDNSVFVENHIIYKCRYMDAVARQFNIRPSNATRVYYVKDGNEKVILLIDLYHLFASTDYEQNYQEHSANQFCMNKLR